MTDTQDSMVWTNGEM